MELANELPMSKVVQLRAAIAPRGFVLPTHLSLMSSDAGNHARSAGLIIVFTDPDDAVTNTSLRATAVFMTMPPIDLPMKEDRRAVARERSLAPLQQPGRRPSIQNIRERYSDYSPPAPNTWRLNILPLGQFRPAPRLSVSPIHIA